MMLLALALAQAHATFTLRQVQAMAPTALADTLLGKDHGPIQKVDIAGGDIMMKSDGLTRVTFVGVPSAAGERKQWCRRIVSNVWFTPVAPQDRLTATTPTRVTKTERWPFYRLAGGNCATPNATFFVVRDEAAQSALMDKMIAARALARGKDPLPFIVNCDDQVGRDGQTRDNRCSEDAARAMLADLPLEKAFQVMPAAPQYIWNGSDRPATPVPHDAEIWTADGGIHVEATIAEQNGRIRAIFLRRLYTPPF